ncbi:hypothetical protein OUZ56_012058 [Daphnia magna]|uniref:CCHC-type domain-containing protein n=1 Tax=Daphnia magna TaxID=35525 RepID=A0ABQ9Z255_9CRUS|nr:hypothetical protein OUZ56_012058 [Daphnia magna]
MVERVAVAENWTDAQRIQVAARRLLKTALDWHIHAGHAFANWGDWSNAFIANFSLRLNFSEWHRLVEERRQKIGESGIEYALDKHKLLRVSPIPLNNEQMVSFLIDGLAKGQHVAAMTTDIPGDVTEFIQRIRTLETLGVASRADSFPPPPGPAGPSVIPATPTTQNFAAALSSFGDKLVNQITAQFNKLSVGSRGAGRGGSSSDASGGAGHEHGMGGNGRGGGGWVEPSARKCYNCGVVGHISRPCPSKTGKEPSKQKVKKVRFAGIDDEIVSELCEECPLIVKDELIVALEKDGTKRRNHTHGIEVKVIESAIIPAESLCFVKAQMSKNFFALIKPDLDPSVVVVGPEDQPVNPACPLISDIEQPSWSALKDDRIGEKLSTAERSAVLEQDVYDVSRQQTAIWDTLI